MFSMSRLVSVICFCLFTSLLVHAQPQDEVEKFVSTTGLQFGDYELKEGPDTCQQGELKALVLEKEFTLMLGAHALILGLGRAPYSLHENECWKSIESKFSKDRAEGKITE